MPPSLPGPVRCRAMGLKRGLKGGIWRGTLSLVGGMSRVSNMDGWALAMSIWKGRVSAIKFLRRSSRSPRWAGGGGEVEAEGGEGFGHRDFFDEWGIRSNRLTGLLQVNSPPSSFVSFIGSVHGMTNMWFPSISLPVSVGVPIHTVSPGA